MPLPLKQIKDLMKAMEQGGVRRLSLKEKDFEISLERGSEERGEVVMPLSRPVPTHVFHEVSHPSPAVVEKKAGKFITAPLVGTFYLSPGPDAPSFVRVGDRVKADTVVGIIEAMKVMNEVKAGVSGVIEEVLMSTGQPVEFGTKLFRISEAG